MWKTLTWNYFVTSSIIHIRRSTQTFAVCAAPRVMYSGTTCLVLVFLFFFFFIHFFYLLIHPPHTNVKSFFLSLDVRFVRSIITLDSIPYLVHSFVVFCVRAHKHNLAAGYPDCSLLTYVSIHMQDLPILVCAYFISGSTHDYTLATK